MFRLLQSILNLTELKNITETAAPVDTAPNGRTPQMERKPDVSSKDINSYSMARWLDEKPKDEPWSTEGFGSRIDEQPAKAPTDGREALKERSLHVALAIHFFLAYWPMSAW